MIANKLLEKLSRKIEGDLYFDTLTKIIYSTDASAYKETPLAVVVPKTITDLKLIIDFALANNTSIIPRGAGTSLAGQVVGNGIVVDFSKYMNNIIEVNAEQKWVKVEPGVILSELNLYLKSFNLMFGPETSTANRCTMGGMLGNNSCGLHSLIYGSVREHILEVEALLSDNTHVVFKELNSYELLAKLEKVGVEGEIYRTIHSILTNEENIIEISSNYPHQSVPRRNNGYALDALAAMQPYRSDGEPINLSKLIAGSEGTLALVTSMKLNLVELPPQEKGLLCIHFNNLDDVFKANLIALEFSPSAIELMDKTIMDMTKGSIGLQANRFFIEGEPEAILIIELWAENQIEIIRKASLIEKEMLKNGFGYHFPLIVGPNISKVWGLRTAGLGVLSNLPGDAKPVSVVEDTAIPVKQLPLFIEDFNKLLKENQLSAVYHAHIATGELHLRPVLNLKDEGDVLLFRKLATETAALVKKYGGSLSGEHGDGRLRGEFIPYMLGNKVYQHLKSIKIAFDKQSIFNPGKIIDTPPMDSSLRYVPGEEIINLKGFYNYKVELGMTRAIEKCNGSADCRKSEIIGGTMCPSFMATRDELHSTRGRANVLRELLTKPGNLNWADNRLVIDALELCLSCKACKSECPSGIDMAKLKADFFQNHYEANPIPLRSKLIGNLPVLLKIASNFNMLFNVLNNTKFSFIVNYLIGFSVQRKLPKLSEHSLIKWYRKNELKKEKSKTVYLFNDEYLNTVDAEIGMKAILLLEDLGYKVVIPKHSFSGRTYISKGLLSKAKKLAIENVNYLKDIINDDSPLIGIEPSALLTFRDEYLELVPESLKNEAIRLSENVLLFDEFILKEFNNGNIKRNQFTIEKVDIKLHGHCHQKAIATTKSSIDMLQIPENYTVVEMPTGCCGMAGSFGYEKEHYNISMRIGELVLFPEVRRSSMETLIVAPGTSCRDQILHGTGRKALHPVEVLYGALNKRVN